MAEHEACDRRIDRESKKSAAANRENDALRREIRKLRHANFILQRNAENTTEGNYKSRYEKLEESMRIIREVARLEFNGIPEGPPKTLEPWLGPDWARKRKSPAPAVPETTGGEK